MNRRVILEELGITPLWKLRDRSAPGTPEQPQGTERTAEEPSARVTATDTAGAHRTKSVPAEPARAVEQVAKPDSGDRRSRILGMDWNGLKAAVASCTACPLHAKRTNTVFGVGDEQADWLFVGEGPGAEEDAKGEPFVGQAGRLLDNMLGAIAMQRGKNVYIANVVKCRPPGNRNPEHGEMDCCEPYLTRQIMLLKPKLIVAMGRVAASHLLASSASIASLRGRLHDYHGTPLIVTYHPAYLLRNLPDKSKAWVDLCFALDTMAAIGKSSAEPT
jgi:uracil-DNA glycosylase family 4